MIVITEKNIDKYIKYDDPLQIFPLTVLKQFWILYSLRSDQMKWIQLTKA